MVTTNPIQLKPGFSDGYISIKDIKGTEIYHKKIAQEAEIKEFIDKYAKTINGYGLLPSLFCPLRLKGKGLAKDLFFPTLINFAWKANNIGLRIFGSIGGIFLDIVTFIPRSVIGMPSRAIYLKNYPSKIHPLIELIKSCAQSSKALRSGRVIIKIHHKNTKINELQKDGSKNNEVSQDAVETLIDNSFNIAIKKLHIHQSSSQNKIHRISYCKFSETSPWIMLGAGGSSSTNTSVSF